MESPLGATEIPSGTQIKTLIGRAEPEALGGAFNENVRIADGHKALGSYRALDGAWHHSSQKIHRKRCLHTAKDGESAYYHTILAGTIVKPGETADKQAHRRA
jgi:hypothetical protein